jgi:hypothetical protein
MIAVIIMRFGIWVRGYRQGMTRSEPVLACTLGGGLPAMGRRVSDWQAVTARASARRPIQGGVTLTYDHDPALTVELARLAAAAGDWVSALFGVEASTAA